MLFRPVWCKGQVFSWRIRAKKEIVDLEPLGTDAQVHIEDPAVRDLKRRLTDTCRSTSFLSDAGCNIDRLLC